MHAASAAPAPASVSTVTTFDDGWYRSVTDFARRTGWLNGIMSSLTVALIVALALMVGYAAWRAWRGADRAAMAASLWAAAGSVLCIALALGLKQVFHESRPCLALPNVATVQPCPGPADYSFPSDHTTVAVALAAGLWLINRRLGTIGAALALLEGFSRVYLGQHYPHDVLAAFVLSCAVVLGGWRLVRGAMIRLADLVPDYRWGGPQWAARTQPSEVAEATHADEGPQAAARRAGSAQPGQQPTAPTGPDPQPPAGPGSAPGSPPPPPPSAESAGS
jgi:membrane-associated phospholipid phosphatase